MCARQRLRAQPRLGAVLPAWVGMHFLRDNPPLPQQPDNTVTVTVRTENTRAGHLARPLGCKGQIPGLTPGSWHCDYSASTTRQADP